MNIEISKEKEAFNFKKHGEYNVQELSKLVANFSDEWLLDTSRQKKFEVHKHTQFYSIYNAKVDWKLGDAYTVHGREVSDKIISAVEGIVKDLEKIHNGIRGQVLLVKLLSGMDIAPHKDSGDYLGASRRHHIPIITSQKVRFGVGDEEVEMLSGQCWEINNNRTHYVINNSETDRVHLIIDIMPQEYIDKEVGIV